ncbi:MAG: hypothetical protein N4A57_11175 [Anaeromicrobium sp.]|jgi:CRISPR-associated endoribonuclease Cas6|uniref:hypothetical protein n=1 Tax=Anaeromicrobium sp. TaxID=1929132 RepID=UPI0025ECAB46|nr:hypothetical protein [Anaeromicrobium sp.]MCT4594813.1 hypothetical protein [Anaeromicrobium sp.]
MKYYELRITALLKEDVKMIDVGSVLGRHINYCMSKNEILRDIHKSTLPKLYCYDYPYPFEADKTYKANKVYVFKLKTPKEYIAKEMRKVLSFYNTDKIKPLGCDLRTKRFFNVEKLLTVTPAVTTVDNRNWIVGNDFDLLWKRIDNNLEKKYKQLYGDPIELNGSAIECIDIKNKVPVTMNYKGGKILGNKFELRFKPDELSQKLAFIALSTGILEKSTSIGAGYCISRKG